MDYDLWTCPWIRFFFFKLLLEQVWVFWAALGPAPHQALLPVSSVSANSGPECSCRYSAVCSRPNLSSGLLQTWEQSLEDTRTHSSVTKTVLSLDWGVFRASYLILTFRHLFCLVVFWRELDRRRPQVFSSLYSLIQLQLTSWACFSFLPCKHTKQQLLVTTRTIVHLSALLMFILLLTCDV